MTHALRSVITLHQAERIKCRVEDHLRPTLRSYSLWFIDSYCPGLHWFIDSDGVDVCFLEFLPPHWAHPSKVCHMVIVWLDWKLMRLITYNLAFTEVLGYLLQALCIMQYWNEYIAVKFELKLCVQLWKIVHEIIRFLDSYNNFIQMG